MPVIDLQKDGAESFAPLLDCDVCIIGSGPAGSTLARELSKTDLRVTLLESGGFERDPDIDTLNDIQNVGRARVVDQWSVRNRIVGGSSHTWGGRCAAFDAIDLESRSWVPGSGWPFDLNHLSPYLDRSAPYLGLVVGDGYSDERFWSIARRNAPADTPDPSLLIPFFWQFAHDENKSYPFEYTRFGRDLKDQIGLNVTLVAGATALQIDAVESGRAVNSVEVAAMDGRRWKLRAETVVVCGGGIENPRLLLASRTHSPQGLGNERDLVGRYLMDHLRGAAGLFDLTWSDDLRRRFGRYNVQGNLFLAGLRLSPDAQRAEGLLNCAAWLGETIAEDDPWSALRRFAAGRPALPQDISAIARNSTRMVRGLKQYLADRNGVPRKLDALSLECMCEQLPDADSRITLSEQRDRFEMPISRVDWRVHDIERHTMRRMGEIVAAEFDRMGLPRLALAAWVRDRGDFPADFLDVAHPTGTTRMANDASQGVVDADCEVHGVSGLYALGTSVFPTAGHCNPTQMIVALAIRLADHLKSRVRNVTTIVPSMTETQATPTVLVTGATGRIGRVLVADLLERGYHVRATTSRELPQDIGSNSIEWRGVDFLGETDFDALVAGCDAVLHLAAEIGKMQVMQRVNVDLTRSLADAAERVGVKAFCYTSTVSVYGSGLRRTMTEDAPVLTVDRDVASEYWALDYVRAYGRTKLAGEIALRSTAKTVRYIIMRPTVVVDVDAIIGIREWGRVKRYLAAHRHAHHIYVRDVSDALIWGMQRALNDVGAPGSVETYNLSEDEFAEPTHAQFMRKAYAASGDPRYQAPPLPGFADWLHDFLRFRTLPLRNPLWRMTFPNSRIRAAGYRHRFGMAEANRLALAALRREAAGLRSTSSGEQQGRPTAGATP